MRRRRASSPPRPLAALLVAVALVGVAWALLVPPWQAPDESRHFAYVQSVGERFRLPTARPGKWMSTEQSLAARYTNSEAVPFRPLVKPQWSRAAYARWRRDDSKLPHEARKDAEYNPYMGSNPPGFYVYEAVAYRAASRGDIFDRLYAMRLWGVPLLLVTTLGAWLLAGEIFARNRLLQLVSAALVGLQPMETFITTSVNHDALVYPIWALALWLGVRILKRGMTLSDTIGFFGLVGIALVVRTTSYALVVAALVVLAAATWRRWKVARPRAILTAAAAVLAFALPAGAWFVAAKQLDRPTGPTTAAPAVDTADAVTEARAFASYLWQYYLPRLPFQRPFPVLSTFFLNIPAYDVWVKSGWGAFGWLDTLLPESVYQLLAGVSALVLVAAAVAVLRTRRQIDLWTAAFLGAAAVALALGVHWNEFRVILTVAEPFNQGRYLLPLLPLGGLAVAKAITLLPASVRGIAVAVGLGGLMVLQLLSLWTVAARYYA
jgi:hypothetical protein